MNNGGVPIKIAAKVYKKDPTWVRAGLIAGWLPIGFATRNGERITSTRDISSKKGRINYYINPKLFYEHTGYLYQPNEDRSGVSTFAYATDVSPLKGANE